MNAKTHARMLKISHHPATWFFGFPLSAFLMYRLASVTGVVILFISWWALSLILSILLERPVHCRAPDCDGLMTKTFTQVADGVLFSKSKLEYRCTVCDDIYQIDFVHFPEGDGLDWRY